jgi:hypothetical protein
MKNLPAVGPQAAAVFGQAGREGLRGSGNTACLILAQLFEISLFTNSLLQSPSNKPDSLYSEHYAF